MLKDILRKTYHELPYSWRRPSIYYKQLHLLKEVPVDIKSIKEWQFQMAREIISYAYKNVPGYYQLYSENNVKPEDIRSIEAISLLPCTSKDLIRDNLKDFTSRSKAMPEMSYISTSGSSGIPFGFYVDIKEDFIEEAFVANSWMQIGWNIKQSGILLRGSYIGDEDHVYIKCNNTNFYAHNNSYYASPYYLTQDHYPKYRNLLLNHRELSYLFAYPSSASLLSTLIINNNDAGKFSISRIFLGSENLYDWQVDLINKAFPKASLMSCYGQTERAIFASWCPANHKYHVNPYYGYTELLDSNGLEVNHGELGELVGTAFWSKATPFIRYKTHDIAVKDSIGCEDCGKNFLILDRIDGRLNEAVISKNGRLVSMVSINMHDSTFDNVQKFRFVQKEPGIILLLLSVSNLFNSEKDIKRVQNMIESKLGDGFSMSIVLVDDIMPSKSGKYSFLEQHLDISQSDRLIY